jgi:hypothetical protein
MKRRVLLLSGTKDQMRYRRSLSHAGARLALVYDAGRAIGFTDMPT